MNDFYNSRFYHFIINHKHLLLLIAILLCMSLVLYREYIFGGKLFLFEDFGSDSIRVSLPTYIYFFDWFRNGMPLWSDKIGIGTSVLSHGDIVFDPFTYILFLLGRNGIIYIFVYMVIAKIIFSGIFFWAFLGKYKLSSYAKIIGAITYAFGGYMIVVGQNYVFGTIYVYLPLILFGFEMWLQNRKKWLLILTLTATALYFFYFFYMTAVFFIVYAIFRYFTFYKFSIKHFLKYIFSLAGYSLVALGLSAFFWLPSLALTLTNLRIGSSMPSIGNLFFPQMRVVITVVGRFFGYDIFGDPKIYTGFNGDYFQLALFCGVITLVFIPQIFCEKDKRIRFAYSIFSIVLSVLLLIPFFSYVFNAFSDFTYRWIYILHFSLALLLAIAINIVFNNKRINYKILFATVGGLFVISFVAMIIVGLMGVYPDFSFRTESSASKGFIAFSQLRQHAQIFKDVLRNSFRMFVKDYILIASYLALIILFFHTRYKKIIKIIILVFVCFELVWFPWLFINNRLTTFPDPIKNHVGYFDHTKDAVSYLYSIDSGIYRLDKSYDSVISEYGNTPSDNDTMIQGYRGLKSYNANNQPNYIRFIQYSGIFVKYPDPKWINLHNDKPQDFKDANLNYINGVGDRYILQSFLGVKYYLAKGDIKLPEYYQYLTRVNDIAIYKNSNYLPLGFTFDSYIKKDEFMKLTNSEKDLALLSFVIIDDIRELSMELRKGNVKELKKIKLQKDISDLIKERRKDIFMISSYKDDNIRGEIRVGKNKIFALTIPYDEGWSIYIDGHKNISLKIDNGLIGVELSPGNHIFQLKYFPPKMKLGIIISIITLLIFTFFNKKHIHKALLIFTKQLKSLYKQTQYRFNTLMINIVKTLPTMRNYLTLNLKKSIFYVSIIHGISLFILGGLVTRGQSFFNFFSRDRTNYFMDFYNTLATLIAGPYHNSSIYPPLPLLIYKTLLRFIPHDIVEKGSFAIRDTQSGEIVFLAYMIITLYAFIILLMEIKKGSKIEKYVFTLLMLLSAPFIFQFERANIVFVALLFSMVFVFFKDSKNPIVRELALISLAISAGIKIYPAIFGILLTKEKRFKEAFRLIIYGLGLFIAPFFLVADTNQLPNLINNFLYASKVTTEWGLGYAVNMQNIVRIIAAFFGDFSGKPIIIGKIFSIVILLVGIYIAFQLRSKWKTTALLTLLMIMVPLISYEYTLIFMIIPLIMFLDKEEKVRPNDYVYLVCFILMFIPLALGRVDIINRGFGFVDIPMPLTYVVLIQNIATSTMVLCLIVEGIVEQKAKSILTPIGTFLWIFVTKIYGTKFTGMKRYIIIVGKVFLTIPVILIIFGDAMFSDVYDRVKSSRPIYTILKPVEVPKDITGPIISKIEPQYLHYIDKVVVTGSGFSLGRNKRAKFMSNYGEITPQYWSDNKFIFIVPITWKLGDVKIWVEKPMVQNGSYLAGNKAEIEIIDRLGDFNDDDIKYFGQIKYLDKETRNINEFRNYKLREYKFSRWIPTKVFQLYADTIEVINFIKKDKK